MNLIDQFGGVLANNEHVSQFLVTPACEVNNVLLFSHIRTLERISDTGTRHLAFIMRSQLSDMVYLWVHNMIFEESRLKRYFK